MLARMYLDFMHFIYMRVKLFYFPYYSAITHNTITFDFSLIWNNISLITNLSKLDHEFEFEI